VFPGDRKKIDIGDFYADYRLITEKLGWVPRTSLQTALTQTLAFYRGELARYL
jgi:UDP-glucose 4-epimerase